MKWRVSFKHFKKDNTEGVEVLFLQLVKPLPFDADDGKPVDLIFALVVPKQCTEDHSKLLSGIADRFAEPELLEQLRNAKGVNKLWQLLSSS